MKLYLIFPLILLLLGCGKTSSEYFPLGENIKWEYRIQKELGNNQNEGKSIIAQLDRVKEGGVYYFPYLYANGETLYYNKNESGIKLSSSPDQNGQIFIKTPIEINSNWLRETRIELLNSRHESFAGGESFISQGEKIFLDNTVTSFDETITVPAGVFSNTMRIDSSVSITVKERTRGIDAIQIEQTEWYARGVGLIKRTRRELSVPEKYNATQVTELIRFERD